MDAPFAVEAENIFFSYASELPVLRGLSMRVERGCFACVLGHSGCGKSTLLNLVMGLSRPSSGVVKINGAEAEGPGTDRAIVFQDCSLFPWMTAQENVAFAIRHARKITKQASAALAADFLSQVGLYESRGKYPNQLSGGMKQRVAIDGAIKFARKYTGRSGIITFKTAYHGATYGALSASAISLNMRRGIGPMLPGFHHFSYPQCAKCPWHEKPESCSLACLEEIKTAFSLYLPPDEVSAVIIEPIGGDIGLVVPPARWVRELAALCREHGILFVSDEVQQGMGRTGKWFAIEHFGVVPDIIAIAKSLASGMPLSAVVMRAEIADSLRDPGHCITLAANAVCCRAALETIKIIEDENLIEKSVRTGENIKAKLAEMKKTLPLLGETRGLGLTIAQEIVDENGEPDRGACAKICYRCWERGLIITFLSDNVLRIQPPLVITDEETERALEILRESIEDYRNGLIGDEVLEFARGWA